MHKHFLRGALLAAIAFALSVHILSVPFGAARAAPIADSVQHGEQP